MLDQLLTWDWLWAIVFGLSFGSQSQNQSSSSSSRQGLMPEQSRQASDAFLPMFRQLLTGAKSYVMPTAQPQIMADQSQPLTANKGQWIFAGGANIPTNYINAVTGERYNPAAGGSGAATHIISDTSGTNLNDFYNRSSPDYYYEGEKPYTQLINTPANRLTLPSLDSRGLYAGQNTAANEVMSRALSRFGLDPRPDLTESAIRQSLPALMDVSGQQTLAGKAIPEQYEQARFGQLLQLAQLGVEALGGSGSNFGQSNFSQMGFGVLPGAGTQLARSFAGGYSAEKGRQDAGGPVVK